MLIGLISDTHGLLRPDVLTRFERVDLILHAGDVGNADILTQLQVLAPVHAVFGNTDGFDLRDLVPARLELELEGWRVLVTHGHELGSPRPALLRQAYRNADIIVYGHTHVALIQQVEGTLLINPGAAGPARFHLEPSIALLELSPRHRRAELVGL